jgi:hypothetical protein
MGTARIIKDYSGRHEFRIMRCEPRDVLSVATTKYPSTIGAKRTSSFIFVQVCHDSLLTFIVKMHNTEACDSAPPFRDRYICKIELESPNEIEITKVLCGIQVHVCGVRAMWNFGMRLFPEDLGSKQALKCWRSDAIYVYSLSNSTSH